MQLGGISFFFCFFTIQQHVGEDNACMVVAICFGAGGNSTTTDVRLRPGSPGISCDVKFLILHLQFNLVRSEFMGEVPYIEARHRFDSIRQFEQLFRGPLGCQECRRPETPGFNPGERVHSCSYSNEVLPPPSPHYPL